MTELNTRVFLGIVIIILILTGGTTLYLNLSGTINEFQGEHAVFQTLDMVKIHGTYYDVHRSHLHKENHHLLNKNNFKELTMVEMLTESLDIINGKIFVLKVQLQILRQN